MRLQEIPYGEGLAALLPRIESGRYPILLESRLPAGGLGRFSLLAIDPVTRFAAWGERWHVWESGQTRSGETAPWLELARLHRVQRRRTPLLEEAREFPLTSGALGYASYESGLAWERVVPRQAPDLDVPDQWWGFYETLVIADEAARRLWLVVDTEDLAGEEERLVGLRDAVASWSAGPLPRWPDPTGGPLVANFTPETYAAALARVRSYIASGDVYQVNLAQRFQAPLPPGGGRQVYARLRERSAAPYAAYLDFGYGEAVGCSPERFLRVRGGRVETRPIKGTRPRGRTPAEDERLREELLASSKDRAELLMIVDLERNDLGRVCAPGSVRVSDLYHLEEHPTVFHLVAGVEGQLAEGRDFFDLLRATFPGGSITGAPKVRAMQIINELEPHRRQLYTGSVGYLGFRDQLELNIAIRTVQCVAGQAYFHAGSGVVWDSEAASEYAETLAKARALVWAVTGTELNPGEATG